MFTFCVNLGRVYSKWQCLQTPNVNIHWNTVDLSIDCIFQAPSQSQSHTQSEAILNNLLKEGADLYQVNVSNGNILHSLVAGSSFDDVLEERSVFVYKKLVSLLDENELNKLLMHENSDGLRPLEQAVNLGTLVLYEAMQLTPGVYVTKTIEKGVFKEEWIDITEYETYDPGHRRAKSPPFLMAFSGQERSVQPEGYCYCPIRFLHIMDGQEDEIHLVHYRALGISEDSLRSFILHLHYKGSEKPKH